MEFKFTNIDNISFNIVFERENNSQFISIYVLSTLPRNLSWFQNLPLVKKDITNNILFWEGDDIKWVPKDVQEYCSRLYKNILFL